MIDPKLELEIKLLHSRICQALSDPNRILILYSLHEKPCFVNELVEALDLPQSTISRHLGILRDRNLVTSERDGSTVVYKLVDHRLIEVLDMMREILSTQLANSAEIANKLLD